MAGSVHLVPKRKKNLRKEKKYQSKQENTMSTRATSAFFAHGGVSLIRSVNYILLTV